MKHYKISDYKDDIDDYNDIVRITDLENFFTVHEDKKRNVLAFNLNSTVYFNAADQSLQTATVNHKMFWPQLSYMLYGTPRLSWLLMKLNNVKAEDMFKSLSPNDKVRYIGTEEIQKIVSSIK